MVFTTFSRFTPMAPPKEWRILRINLSSENHGILKSSGSSTTPCISNCPVHTLPVELLIEIFSYLPPHGATQRSNPAVASVCWWWRSVAHQTRSLWNVAQNGWPQRSLAHLNYEFTSNFPIHVRWNEELSWLSLYYHEDEELRMLLSEQLHRIAIMELTAPSDFLDNMTDGASELPLLRKLCFKEISLGSQSIMPSWYGKKAPRLEILSLQGAPVPWQSTFIQSAASHLRKLEVRYPRGERCEVDSFLECLESMSALDSLVWEGHLPHATAGKVLEPPIRVHMPRLRNLRLAGEIWSCAGIVQSLSCGGPVRVSVSVEGGPDSAACSSMLDIVKSFYGKGAGYETQLSLAVSKDVFAIGVGRPRPQDYPTNMKWCYHLYMYVAFHDLPPTSTGPHVARCLASQYPAFDYHSLLINGADIHDVNLWCTLLGYRENMDQVRSLILVGSSTITSMFGAISEYRQGGMHVLPSLESIDLVDTSSTIGFPWIRSLEEEARIRTCFQFHALHTIRIKQHGFMGACRHACWRKVVALIVRMNLVRRMQRFVPVVECDAWASTRPRRGYNCYFADLIGHDGLDMGERSWPWREGGTWEGLAMTALASSGDWSSSATVLPQIDFYAPPKTH